VGENSAFFYSLSSGRCLQRLAFSTAAAVFFPDWVTDLENLFEIFHQRFSTNTRSLFPFLFPPCLTTTPPSNSSSLPLPSFFSFLHIPLPLPPHLPHQLPSRASELPLQVPSSPLSLFLSIPLLSRMYLSPSPSHLPPPFSAPLALPPSSHPFYSPPFAVSAPPPLFSQAASLADGTAISIAGATTEKIIPLRATEMDEAREPEYRCRLNE